MAKLMHWLKHHLIEHVELRADLARAFRAMIAFTVPLALLHRLNEPAEAVFVSTAALNLSLPDLRGAYRVRLGILATMILLASSSAFLGVCCAGSTVGAVLGMALVALGGGVWRHLSSDYGPSMSVSSALLFLLGLSQTGGVQFGLHLAELTALGGMFSAGLHTCTWFVRPQHALRYAVAETWVAVSDLIAAMRPVAAADSQSASQSIAHLEGELRATLDRTFVILGGAEGHQRVVLITDLEAMRREVVHLSMRAIALNAALEPVMSRPGFDRCLPVMDSVLKALSDAARSVAITLIMHRAENLSALKVRLRRCQHLLSAFDEQILAMTDQDAVTAQVRAALAQVGKVLPDIATAAEKTSDHNLPRFAFGGGLPDISSYSLRSFAAWMRPAPRMDPVLVRHVTRMAVFTMFAVGLYEGFNIPRGYWIAFTIMVVLQPDYGSTRQRAVARIGGTVGGSMVASALMWVTMPGWMVDGLATLTAFIFAYFLRRRYWVAIFFVTINLMLIMETLPPVHKGLMLVRVAATLTGGALALVAARIFWPVWEGEKFPTLLAAAIRANRTFLLSLAPGLGLPAVVREEPLMARRRAENANRTVSALVERLLGEPTQVQENPERAAALATYCQRITRALTALAVQLPTAGKVKPAPGSDGMPPLADFLERLAHIVETGYDESAADALAADLGKVKVEFTGTDAASRNVQLMTSPAGLIAVQLVKMITELRAMTLALRMNPADVGKAAGSPSIGAGDAYRNR